MKQLLLQHDAADPLLWLALEIPWDEFDGAFSIDYTQTTGTPSKTIRMMVGLLVLKQLENLSNVAVVLQWKRNPYYQAFCGMREFQRRLPCHSPELEHFHQHIGAECVEWILRLSVCLHGKTALEKLVHIDTMVQERNIIYPTDNKLAIKIINRLNLLAKVCSHPIGSAVLAPYP